MIFGSYSFWPFRVNGISNCMATSIFILALLFYKNNKWVMYGLMALAYGIHHASDYVNIS